MPDRGVNATALTNLTSQVVTDFPLIEMQLASGILRIAALNHSVDWNGFTWLPDRGLGRIEAIKESGAEMAGLSFELSAVPTALISAALSENVRGRPIIVRNATLNGTVVSVDDNVWTGQLDTMTIEDGKDSAVIRVTAEHRMVFWQSPHPVDFSHAAQQLVDPTDTFYSRMADIANKTLVWPSAAFFKK
jgi:hypothetical protein